MIIEYQNENTLRILIDSIYLFIKNNFMDISYFTDKAILTTKNEYINYINNKILEEIPENIISYHSLDSVPEDNCNIY